MQYCSTPEYTIVQYSAVLQYPQVRGSGQHLVTEVGHVMQQAVEDDDVIAVEHGVQLGNLLEGHAHAWGGGGAGYRSGVLEVRGSAYRAQGQGVQGTGMRVRGGAGRGSAYRAQGQGQGGQGLGSRVLWGLRVRGSGNREQGSGGVSGEGR